jgi:hypothetical protein
MVSEDFDRSGRMPKVAVVSSQARASRFEGERRSDQQQPRAVKRLYGYSSAGECTSLGGCAVGPLRRFIKI